MSKTGPKIRRHSVAAVPSAYTNGFASGQPLQQSQTPASSVKDANERLPERVRRLGIDSAAEPGSPSSRSPLLQRSSSDGRTRGPTVPPVTGSGTTTGKVRRHSVANSPLGAYQTNTVGGRPQLAPLSEVESTSNDPRGGGSPDEGCHITTDDFIDSLLRTAQSSRIRKGPLPKGSSLFSEVLQGMENDENKRTAPSGESTTNFDNKQKKTPPRKVSFSSENHVMNI